jgi:hypothetical protein
MILTILGLASWGFGLLVWLASKSAIHEILSVIFILNGSVLISGARIVSTLGWNNGQNGMTPLEKSKSTSPMLAPPPRAPSSILMIIFMFLMANNVFAGTIYIVQTPGHIYMSDSRTLLPAKYPCEMVEGNKVSVKKNASEVESKPPTPIFPQPSETSKPNLYVQAPIVAEKAVIKVEPDLYSWEAINAFYNSRTITNLRKDERIKQDRGKIVTWSGEVSSVGTGFFGKLVLQVKMNEKTITSDVVVGLKDSEKDAAMRLSEGDNVTFSGKLQDWGHFMGITLSDGEIKP